MASVLGLPRLKNKSQSIVTCRIEAGYVPVIGTACTLVDGTIQPTVTEFDGEFYGIICETFKKPEPHCTVVLTGLSVAVKVVPNVEILPHLETFFEISSGFLTDATGEPVSAQIQKLNEIVIDPKTSARLPESGSLINFTDARTLDAPIIPPDFNKPDFATGDFQ